MIVSVVPEMVIWASPTGMVRVSLAPSEIVILPVPAAMASLKVSTMLLVKATPVASSAGVLLAKVGAVVSAAAEVVKFNDVVLVMPAYRLPARSAMAVAAIWT